MKINSITIFTFVFLVLSGVLAWRFITYKKFQPPIHDVLYDPSDSKINGCACLREYVRQLINSAGTKGETIVLISLGSPQRVYQPEVIKTFVIPINDSPFSNAKKFDEEKNRIAADFENTCNSIPQTSTTPLFQGVQTSIEDLNQKCSTASNCTLFVQTDLEEIVNQKIIQMFKDEKSGKQSSVEPPKIDNSKVLVTFSGTSEVVITPNAQNKNVSKNNAELLKKAKEKLGDDKIWQKVWKSIFINGDSVNFEPFCTNPNG